MKTYNQDGIKIKMGVNKDNTVNLDKIMKITFQDGTVKKAYPDILPDKPFGTVKHQFDYAKTIKRFFDVANS